jgi:hypothetical protein
MVRVTITTSRGIVKAKFMTPAILDTIAPLYPLQHSTVGVRVNVEPGRYWEYYCKQHREAAPTNAAEITLEEAAHEVAWCKECRTVLYLNAGDREWTTLRDRLCQGNYSNVEIYRNVQHDVGTHYLISYRRLVPGALEVETMFPEGAFDVKDADRDRRELWPNSLYVPASIFDQELAKRANLATLPQACSDYVNDEQRGWQLCGATMATTCYQCHRPICGEHQDEYVYLGDKEPTTICAACRQEIRQAYGK